MSIIPFSKLRLAAAVAALSLLAIDLGIASAAGSPEYSVKAAYLSKFGTFVQWPADTFPEPDSPLNLCIIGTDPFGPVLDEVAAGLQVGTHPIKVKRLASIDPHSDCQIAFVDGNDQRAATQIVDGLRGTNILTVTDSGNDSGAGIINFLIKDNRVRFGVDDEAATRNGLNISSRLLMLAVYVRGVK
jgi:hypothetical protein